MKTLAYWFVNRSRYTKASILISIDIVFAIFSLWLAFSLRLGELYIPTENIWILFAVSPVLAVPIFLKMGLYRAIIRYIGGRALWTIFQAVSLYAIVFTVVVFQSGIDDVPRTVTALNWLVLLILIAGSRFVARCWLSTAYKGMGGHVSKDRCTRKVIIYGAGSAGAQLASALECGYEFNPVAFIDDNKSLHKQKINGRRIYPLSSLNYLITRYDVTDILLAIPSVGRYRRNEVISLLEAYPVHVKSIPGMVDIAEGKVKFDDLQEVDITDLLGRDAVQPDQALFHANIVGKVVLVSGAGGSIGSELCRQIIQLQPAKLILFELNEFALYTIERDLKHSLAALAAKDAFEIVAVLGSVTDEQRINKVCAAFKVQTIYHAAAYKHVPMVEHNPAEAIKNNVFGTLCIAQAAIAAEVETFVLISTDKAVRPTNTMGATKRFAELVLQGLSLQGGHNTRFTMVRFGNVLGSSGSVVPLFREQIAHGGPVTVTDARIIRYFMTIPEAAQLVIQAGAMGQGGDVFVLDMGKPVRIVDLARRMIHLSGLNVKDEDHPEGDVGIIFTGLRPGEKLYEELLIGDNVTGTRHCRIMRAEEQAFAWDVLDKSLQQLRRLVAVDDFEGMRAILKASVSGFEPQCEVSDLLWQVEQQQELELSQASVTSIMNYQKQAGVK